MENQQAQHFVTLLRNKEGDSITHYGSTGYGFIEVGCNRLIGNKNEFVIARIKGSLEVLSTVLSDYFVDNKMPGTIIVKEFLESQVPEPIKKSYYHKRKPYSEAVLEFIKMDSQTGLPIIVNDERVVRITEFVERLDVPKLSTLIVEYYSAK